MMQGQSDCAEIVNMEGLHDVCIRKYYCFKEYD